jgi:DNA polymerase IV (DinB-like DNA polymerase)
MDSFYTAVEMRERPELKGRPVIIIQGPRNDVERGAVAACSYEARKYGVRSGMAASTAHRLCPDAVYLKPNHPLYEEVSQRIMVILRNYSDTVEKASIDEAYLDITTRASDYPTAERLARKIKQTIRRKEKITCSIGVAPNKTIAKIASAHQKPNGLTIVRTQDAKQFLEPLAVDEIPGVGRKTTEELKRLGINTIGELAETRKVTLVEHFGKNGAWMWDAANGVDETPVREAEEKSLSSQRTLDEDTDDWHNIHSALDPMIAEVHGRTEEEGYLYQTIGVMVMFQDFQTRTKSKTLRKHTDSPQILGETAHILISTFKADSRKVRRIGVRVANLKHKEYAETPLDRYL